MCTRPKWSNEQTDPCYCDETAAFNYAEDAGVNPCEECHWYVPSS